MLATNSSIITGWLMRQDRHDHSYELPIYTVHEDPDVIHLLHAVRTSTASPGYGLTPPLQIIVGFARMCVENGWLQAYGAHLTMWTKSWILTSWGALEAEILEVALLTNNALSVVETYRAFVLGRLTILQLEKAEILTQQFPSSRTSASSNKLYLANRKQCACLRYARRFDSHFAHCYCCPSQIIRL